MLLLLSLAVAQAVSASPPERVDLTIAQPCQESASEGEIVVCGSRRGESPYRITQPAKPGKSLPKAEVKVAEGVAVAAEAESGEVGGVPTNRGMLRLRIKF